MYTRSIIIESADTNVGANMYVGTTEALASTANRSIVSSGNPLIVSVDNYAGLNAYLNLNDIWFDGDISGDKLVVHYIEDDSRLGKDLS